MDKTPVPTFKKRWHCGIGRVAKLLPQSIVQFIRACTILGERAVLIGTAALLWAFPARSAEPVRRLRHVVYLDARECPGFKAHDHLGMCEAC